MGKNESYDHCPYFVHTIVLVIKIEMCYLLLLCSMITIRLSFFLLDLWGLCEEGTCKNLLKKGMKFRTKRRNPIH
jgi:hypothetical protein